eukprot:scaffold431_cov315-Prasinococcus_capsulatus_cf.AAC.8
MPAHPVQRRSPPSQARPGRAWAAAVCARARSRTCACVWEERSGGQRSRPALDGAVPPSRRRLAQVRAPRVGGGLTPLPPPRAAAAAAASRPRRGGGRLIAGSARRRRQPQRWGGGAGLLGDVARR